jgi:hypothetical protein
MASTPLQSKGNDEDITELTSKFEKVGGSINADKANQFDSDQASHLSMICVDNPDYKLTQDIEDAKARQEAIRTKCKDAIPITSYINGLLNFRLGKGVAIEEAWVKLKEIRRKVVAIKPRLKDIYSEDILLYFLMRRLPEEYSIIRETLNSQESLSVQAKILKLQTKEAELQEGENEEAHPSYIQRSRGYQPRRHHKFSIYSTNSESKHRGGCYLCGEQHYFRNCDMLECPKAGQEI